MTLGPLLSVLLVVAQPPAAAPAENPYVHEVSAALADAKKLGPDSFFTRYLSLWWVDPADRGEWRQVLSYATNGTSREAVIYKPRWVTDTLVAVNVLWFGRQWAETWENLAATDPHFHVQVDLTVGKPGRMYFARDKGSRAGWYNVDVVRAVRVPALAPWTGADHAELVGLTNSAAPIVRGDWFFSRIAVAAGHPKDGYYAFLGLKKLADFDALIQFDRKKSQDIRREVAAIVARSGVANFPRQIFREQALTGVRWETRDVLDDNADAHNALRQLDADFKPQAFEIYGTLPNYLFGFALADDKGNLQDTAPDKIGSDTTATGNDRRIHAFLSCTRCHLEGLRPINDWARKVYTNPLKLTSPDPLTYARLVQLYLGELSEHLDGDNATYAGALKRATGWKPADAAKGVGRAWAWYVERDLLPKDLARELGVPEEEYLRVLRTYYRTNTLGDPVLASHLANPPVPIRSDDTEQLYPIVAGIIFTGQPGGVAKTEKATSDKIKP